MYKEKKLIGGVNMHNNKTDKKASHSFLSVSKNTTQSLKIVSVDPKECVFQLKNNSYIKIVKLLKFDELSKEQKKQFLKELLDKVNLRMRITTCYRENNSAENYLTLFDTTEKYTAVEEKFDKALSVLQDLLKTYGAGLQKIDLDEIMQAVQKNAGMPQNFSYLSAIRGKKDWKRLLFNSMEEEKTYFKVGDTIMSPYFAVNIGNVENQNLTEEIKNFGVPFYLVCDFQKIDGDTNLKFNKSIANKYNRSSSFSDMDTEEVNFSFSFAFLADSKDTQKVVEDALLLIFAGNEITVSPLNATTILLDSILSFGLVDFCAMRNTKIDNLSTLSLNKTEEEK